jgi:dipeptidase E
MRESGFMELMPSLTDTVWVGVSAGSMVMTPRIGSDFVAWDRAPNDGTLGVVDFCICPHLAPDGERGNTMADAEEWAAGIGHPAYALDDQSAIRVVDGQVDVVSEGRWEKLR